MKNKKFTAGRREFLQQSGAIMVGFSLAPAAFGQQPAPKPAPLPGSLNANRMLDSWLRINPDGTVTVSTGKVELGQGILTALAQIAADELDVAYERIEMISADTSRSPNEGMTAGSLSVEQSGTALRYAAAEARDILLQLAAARLGVTADKLAVSDGTVTVGGAKTTYWDLAQNVNFKREATARIQPKPPARHQVIGKPVKRRDIPKKVTGGAAYVQDMRLPGMVFGRVVRPSSPPCAARVVRRGGGAWHAGRSGGGARRQLPRRCRRARGAGDQGGAGVARQRQMEGVAGSAAAGHGALRAFAEAAVAGFGGEFQGGCASRRRAGQHARSHLHAAVSVPRLDRPLVRGRADEGRQAHGVDAQPGRVSVAPAPRARDAHARAEHHRRSRRGIRLLRAQRRRRRRVRCRAGRARDQRQAGQAAVDARGRVRLGALRLGDGDEAQSAARRARARSSIGSTTCGAIRTARAPAGPAAICSPAGISPTRCPWARR